jgi:hypothetical protein
LTELLTISVSLVDVILDKSSQHFDNKGDDKNEKKLTTFLATRTLTLPVDVQKTLWQGNSSSILSSLDDNDDIHYDSWQIRQLYLPQWLAHKKQKLEPNEDLKDGSNTNPALIDHTIEDHTSNSDSSDEGTADNKFDDFGDFSDFDESCFIMGQYCGPSRQSNNQIKQTEQTEQIEQIDRPNQKTTEKTTVITLKNDYIFKSIIIDPNNTIDHPYVMGVFLHWAIYRGRGDIAKLLVEKYGFELIPNSSLGEGNNSGKYIPNKRIQFLNIICNLLSSSSSKSQKAETVDWFLTQYPEYLEYLHETRPLLFQPSSLFNSPQKPTQPLPCQLLQANILHMAIMNTNNKLIRVLFNWGMDMNKCMYFQSFQNVLLFGQNIEDINSNNLNPDQINPPWSSIPPLTFILKPFTHSLAYSATRQDRYELFEDTFDYDSTEVLELFCQSLVRDL